MNFSRQNVIIICFMGKNRKKSSEIDPDLLPEEMTKVGHHDKLITYFTNENDNENLFEQWADFYEKRPQVAIIELISIVPYIAGAEIEITEKQIKKSLFDEVKEKCNEVISERKVDSLVELYFKGLDQKPFNFWNKLCNSLIVCKGLFLDAFDIFKDWIFDFAESQVRTLREAAVVAILSIEKFLAESISRDIEALDKLKESENSSVTERQVKEFTSELKSSRALSMQLFTTVIRNRFRDVDPKIRELCIKITSEISMIAPNDFDANILKHVFKNLNDETTKIKKLALNQIKELIAIDDISPFKTFFKTIVKNLSVLCNDSDNGVVVSSLNLLTKLSKKNLLDDFDCTQIFKLTSDEAQNVRNAAAKFLSSYLFNGKIKKSIKSKNKEEINEAQLREFEGLASSLSDPELAASVEAFNEYLDCLQDWELIIQIILLCDGDKEGLFFIKLLEFSASNSSSKDKLTIAMVRHLSKLLNIYKKKKEAISSLISTTIHFDTSSIDGTLAKKQFTLLLESFHTMFNETDDFNICNNIISSLLSWKKSGGKISTIVQKEIKSIANDFKNLDDNLQRLKKFYLVCSLNDFSQDEKLRNFLIESVDSDDEEFSSISIKCLTNFYQNDIIRVKNNKKEDKKESQEKFKELQTLFGRKIHSEANNVRTSAFNALGTLYMLCQFIDAKDLIDDTTTYSFFKAFHTLENKAYSFNSLTRPIIIQALPMKFSVHAFWYLQDPELKPRVKEFITSISDFLPIEGYELGELVRNLKYTPTKLKRAMKTMSKYVNAKSAIDSWLDIPDDSLIPYYAPFFLLLTQSDAELLFANATSGQIAKILDKISNNKKITQKDLTYLPPKKGKKEDSDVSDEADEETN